MSGHSIRWPDAPRPFGGVGDREVLVLAFSLDQDAPAQAACAGTLSAAERARAGSFHFPAGRAHYTIGRGVTRFVLADLLGVLPGELRFAYGPQGKPELAAGAHPAGWHFNLSHSAHLALLAVTRLAPVGVDVEQLRPVSDQGAIARRFFSPAEHAALLALPPADQTAGFFNLWTRKEAWLKATGVGITGGLDQVEVSLALAEPARLLRLFGDVAAAQTWTLTALDPAPGFTGALALPVPHATLRCHRWPGL